MEFEEQLDLAYGWIDTHCYTLQEKDDIKQDVALWLWEHPNDSIAEVCNKVMHARLSDESKHQRGRAMSIYNDDGECLDDNIFFVDDRTIEHNEQKSLVTDEQKERVAVLNKTLQAIDCIYARRFIAGDCKIRARDGRNEAKRDYLNNTGRRVGQCLRGLMRSCMHNWSGLAILQYQRRNWQKRLNDQKQWLC